MDRLVTDISKTRGLSEAPGHVQVSGRHSMTIEENGVVNPATTIDVDDLSDSGFERAEEFSNSETAKIPRLPGDGAQVDDDTNEERNCNHNHKLQSIQIGDESVKLPAVSDVNNSIAKGTDPLEDNNCDMKVEKPFNNEIYSAFKRVNVVKGIHCPSLTNSFKAPSLERSYLTYSHRQRQKSLIIVNVVDLVLKAVLTVIWVSYPHDTEAHVMSIAWTICCLLANIGICLLGCWRSFANNYLHWAAAITWLLLNVEGFVGRPFGFAQREYLVWYMLFVMFVPYAMLPLPLKWCVIAGTATAVSHLIVVTILKFSNYKPPVEETNCILSQLIANFLIYLAINVAGMYTKYLTDRGQRLAFIETHKAMEHKKESEKELQRTQKLLDSILPMVVNNEIRKEMYKSSDANVESQFNKFRNVLLLSRRRKR